MTDYRSVLERAGSHAPSPDLDLERVLRRRDRKRRNERILAGVVGMAIFLAAVWIVASAGSIDRTETPAVTGSTETGPTETGSTDTGASNPSDDEPMGLAGLPPKGAEPSSPVHGKLIWSDFKIHPWRTVHVYADGRVIWMRQTAAGAYDFLSPTTGWLERSLTPKAVSLVRSGGIPETISARMIGTEQETSLWKDPEAKPYVPSRYAVCVFDLRLLPQQAQDLLLASMNDAHRERWLDAGFGSGCAAVTTEEARELDAIFAEAGFERREVAYGILLHAVRFGDSQEIEIMPVLPNGSFPQCCPG